MTQEFDQLILNYLFDAGSTNGKLDIISRIVNHYQPTELPLTFNQVLFFLKDVNPHPPQHLIARFFLMQAEQPQYSNYKWGLAIHQRFDELHHSEKNLEALFVFYQYNLIQKWKEPYSKLSSDDHKLIYNISQRLKLYSKSESSMISKGARAALFKPSIYSMESSSTTCRMVISTSGVLTK